MIVSSIVQGIVALGPLAVLAAVAWLIWAIAGLSIYTIAGSIGAAMFASSQWGWTGMAALDAAAIAALVGYALDCAFDPRSDCWWCKGTPKRRNARRFFHMCLICGGSGQRKRWGSKLYARHRAHADG